MRLFLDLDETLIKALFDFNVKKMTTEPFGTFTIGGHDRFIYLRPDLHLLEGIPFDILTSGSDEYAGVIATMLRDAGMIVQNVFDRDDIDRAYGYSDGETPGQPITLEPCVLIDDMTSTMAGMEGKRKALPRVHHLQIAAITTRPTGGLGSPQELVISDYRDEAMSLGECLRRYRELAV